MTSNLLMQISLSRKTLLPVTVIKSPIDKVLCDICVCMKDYLLHENTETEMNHNFRFIICFSKIILTFILSLTVSIFFSLAVTFTQVFIAMCSYLKYSIPEGVGRHTRPRIQPIYKFKKKILKLTRNTGFLHLVTQTVNDCWGRDWPSC